MPFFLVHFTIQDIPHATSKVSLDVCLQTDIFGSDAPQATHHHHLVRDVTSCLRWYNEYIISTSPHS